MNTSAPTCFADDFELVHGGGALGVGRDEEHPLLALQEAVGELAAEGGLARALKAADHDDGGAVLGLGERAMVGAQEVDHLVVDDLDHLLRGVEALQGLEADRLLFDAGARTPWRP